MPLLPSRANTEDNNQTLDDRSPVPAGTYLCHIAKTEFKQTKKKDGHYLSVHFKILDGEYAGRMIFTNLNLDNPNPVAQEIANKELNSICAACGQEDVEDSDELLEIPLCVSAKVTAATDDWPAGNETTGYAPAEEYEAEESDEPVEAVEEDEEEEEPAPKEKPKKKAAPAGKKPLPWEKKK